jgi:membrane protease subunit HflK
MLVAGIPMYVCASASTPIAAALLVKGLSPGAAIVFLLAGPATNLGSIIILKKFLGSRSLFVYLTAITVMTLFFGFIVNAIFPGNTFPLKIIENPIETTQFSYIKLGASIVLFGLFFRSFLTSPIPDEWHRCYDYIYRFARLCNDSLNHHTHFKFTQHNVIILILWSLVTTYLSTMFLVVEPGQLGFVRRFGKIHRENLPPGIHMHFPLPISRGEAYPMQEVRHINIGFRGKEQEAGTVSLFERNAYQESLYITADENIIDINYVIHYDIKPEMAISSIYLVSELDSIIRSIAIKSMIKTIGTYPIDEVYTTERLAVEQAVRGLVQEHLDCLAIGIRILQVYLVYVHAPGRVHFDFRDVASAQEDRNRSINLAEVYATERINMARGNGHRIIQEARSYSTSLTNHSKGESQGFTEQSRSYRLSPKMTRFRLYLETMETVLPGIRKYVKPPKGKVENLDLYMLDPDILNGSAVAIEKNEKEVKKP